MARNDRAVLILQARMGSTRLPGKVLMDLAGASLLGRILERVKRVRGLDGIVVATTSKAEDDACEHVAVQAGVASCFRGSEHDLVDRYYQAARVFAADTILRLPADNPCSQPEGFEQLLAAHRASGHAFSTNIMQVDGNGWPDGIGVEAMRLDALERVWRTEHDPLRREHVASSFYDYNQQRPVDPSCFSVGTVACPVEWQRPDLVLDVNTAEEYAYIKALYEYLYPRNPAFGISDIIEWHDHVYDGPPRPAHP